MRLFKFRIMNRDATGSYRISATGGEQVRAFVQLPLPPCRHWRSPDRDSYLGARYS